MFVCVCMEEGVLLQNSKAKHHSDFFTRAIILHFGCTELCALLDGTSGRLEGTEVEHIAYAIWLLQNKKQFISHALSQSKAICASEETRKTC